MAETEREGGRGKRKTLQSKQGFFNQLRERRAPQLNLNSLVINLPRLPPALLLLFRGADGRTLCFARFPSIGFIVKAHKLRSARVKVNVWLSA